MRLIDADKLPKYTGYALSASDVAIAVENAPTVDAVPVRHGRWQGVSPFVDSLECSECRYCITDEEFKTPYCSWCGAKMEE